MKTEAGRMSCDDEGRGRNDAAESEGTPKIAAKPPKAVRGKEGSPVGFKGDVTPTIVRFQNFSLQNCETMHFCFFKPPNLLQQH